MRRIAFLLSFLLFFNAVFAEEFSAGEVTTFALPDCDNSYTSFIEGASFSLYMNAYTFSSPLIARSILEVHERGVNVSLMVDASPVGGISDEEWTLLKNLSGSGISVYLWQHDGPGFNHAKYIVADNSSLLISTENPSGSANRGWSAAIPGGPAAYFSGLFFRDLERGAKIDFTGNFPLPLSPADSCRAGIGPETFYGNFTIGSVIAPDNAADEILRLINSANTSLYIEQFYIYKNWGSKRDGFVKNPFLEAAINAARRGVEVKILMDSTWYNVDGDKPNSNLNTMLYVNSIAREGNLPLEARLIDLESAPFTKIHAKGVIVDNTAALISSVNWNEYSPTRNRETGVIIYGEPAGYFAGVFMVDWAPREMPDEGFDEELATPQSGGSNTQPQEMPDEGFDEKLLVIPAALAAALLYLKRRK